MTVLSFVSKLGRGGRRRKGTPARKPPGYRLGMEALEERSLLSANVLQTNLVSDLPGVAQVQDPNLVNPWGISESSTSPFWISDNNAGVSTLYNVPGANNTPVSINPLVVSIPTPGDPLGASGTPTGTVFNIDGGATGGFTVSGVDKNGNPITASAAFLFATEDGTLVGWNPAVNPKGFDPAKAGTYGIIAVDNSGNNFTKPDPAKQTGAVYKGLAIASSTTPPIFAVRPQHDGGALRRQLPLRQGRGLRHQLQARHAAGGCVRRPEPPQGLRPVQRAGPGRQGLCHLRQAGRRQARRRGRPGQRLRRCVQPGRHAGPARREGAPGLARPARLAVGPGAGAVELRGPQRRPAGGQLRDGSINVFNPTTGTFLGTPERPRRRAHPDRRPVGAEGRQRRQRRRRQHGVLHRRPRPRDARPVRLADAGGAGGRRHGRPHVSQRYFPDRGQPERDDADAAERQRVELREALPLHGRRPGLCPAPGGQPPAHGRRQGPQRPVRGHGERQRLRPRRQQPDRGPAAQRRPLAGPASSTRRTASRPSPPRT